MKIKWKKIDPDNNEIWNGKDENDNFLLGEGDSLVGRFQGVRENVGPNNSNLYSFKVKDGKVLDVWGSTLLDTRFKNLNEGELVKVVYLGKEQSQKSGRNYRNYEVWHEDKEAMEEAVNKDEDDIPVVEGDPNYDKQKKEWDQLQPDYKEEDDPSEL